MNNSEAYKLIGERAGEMTKDSKIQNEMMKQIKAGKTKEQVEHWLYMCAICSLCGIDK
jgi:hypothetical protein